MSPDEKRLIEENRAQIQELRKRSAAIEATQRVNVALVFILLILIVFVVVRG